jgi:hypothetical protein
MADFASIAAATAAGYAIERGQNQTGFYTNLVKSARGVTGESGETQEMGGHGNDASSQAAADTQALASLNAERSERYGNLEPAAPSLDEIGNPTVVDQT